jgi:[glutamine synthetase] adenylyltransferase / [glutamine synthetase]-adenylyl-L-tyrosine phosphorylase
MQENTRIADAAIRCALSVAGGEEALAVFALGRLGTNEFDIASDADLLFVRLPESDSDHARLHAERLMHTLAAYTREGTIFAVDARLRPHGGEGELVVTPGEVEKYLAEEAQPWEALTYTKLRFVAGRAELGGDLLPSVYRHITRRASHANFARAAVDMRARQEKSNRFARSFKLARGGFYDIDFLASFLMLKHQLVAAESTDARLRRLHDSDVLGDPLYEELRSAALLYRTMDHAVRLVTGRARPELPAAEHARHATEVLVSRILQRAANDHGLQAELDRTAGRVREIFANVLTE